MMCHMDMVSQIIHAQLAHFMMCHMDMVSTYITSTLHHGVSYITSTLHDMHMNMMSHGHGVSYTYITSTLHDVSHGHGVSYTCIISTLPGFHTGFLAWGGCMYQHSGCGNVRRLGASSIP